MRTKDFRQQKVTYRMEVKVTLAEGEKPERSRVAQYVRMAIAEWYGGGNPENPHLDVKEVTVKVIEVRDRGD